MVGSTFAIEVLSSSSLYGVGTTVIKLLAWVYKAPKAFTRCRANGQELLAAKERRVFGYVTAPTTLFENPCKLSHYY